MTVPIPYIWTGEAMVPVRGFQKRCDEQFYIGQRYRLEVIEERSIATHNHEFAWLAEAWKQLPESVADLYPSPDHLRKRALIDAGWYDEEVLDAGSNAAALRVASFIRSKDDFALVIVRGGFVFIRTAKSQSRRAMDRGEFQKSKEAIMEIVAAMIGVSSGEINENAEATNGAQ